jgi:NAD(P) transhydrogenase subunit beta
VAKGADGKVPPIPFGNKLELFLGAAIGAITFSGSVIAFGKLSGKYKFRLFQGAPVVFSGQHMLNLRAGHRHARAAAWPSPSPRTGRPSS